MNRMQINNIIPQETESSDPYGIHFLKKDELMKPLQERLAMSRMLTLFRGLAEDDSQWAKSMALLSKLVTAVVTQSFLDSRLKIEFDNLAIMLRLISVITTEETHEETIENGIILRASFDFFTKDPNTKLHKCVCVLPVGQKLGEWVERALKQIEKDDRCGKSIEAILATDEYKTVPSLGDGSKGACSAAIHAFSLTHKNVTQLKADSSVSLRQRNAQLFDTFEATKGKLISGILIFQDAVFLDSISKGALHLTHLFDVEETRVSQLMQCAQLLAKSSCKSSVDTAAGFGIAEIMNGDEVKVWDIQMKLREELAKAMKEAAARFQKAPVELHDHKLVNLIHKMQATTKLGDAQELISYFGQGFANNADYEVYTNACERVLGDITSWAKSGIEAMFSGKAFTKPLLRVAGILAQPVDTFTWETSDVADFMQLTAEQQLEIEHKLSVVATDYNLIKDLRIDSLAVTPRFLRCLLDLCTMCFQTETAASAFDV